MRSFCFAAAAVWTIVPTAYPAASSQPGPGAPFDAVPFGFISYPGETTAFEVKWGEPRKIRRVVVESADGQPLPGSLEVHYWHNVWNGLPDPILAEEAAGGQGWAAIDDWTGGGWKKADTRKRTEATRVEFTFEPTGRTEFQNLGNPGVTYRRTLKLRIVAPGPVPAVRVQTFTDAAYRPLSVRIVWGRPAKQQAPGAGANDGQLEAFNGAVVAVRPGEGGRAKVDDRLHWSLPAGSEAAINADLLMAVDPLDARYDRTVVTVRSRNGPFSFDPAEVVRRGRILLDGLGVLVTLADDTHGVESWRAARAELPGRTLYSRIFDEPEQTLERAVKDMPLRHPMEFVHGLPGNRNVMMHNPDGSVLVDGFKHWLHRPPSTRDTDHKCWPLDMLLVRFGLPAGCVQGGRELHEGYLPLLRSWWQDGPVYYEQCAIMDALDGDLSDVQLDQPTLLLVRIRAVNTSRGQSATARLNLSTAGCAMPYTTGQTSPDETLSLEGSRVLADYQGRPQLRFVARTTAPGGLAQAAKGLRWSGELAPGAACELFIAIPSITVESAAEAEAMAQRDFDADARRICSYWSELTSRGAELETPEPWLNGFYKAHLRHMLVNCRREPGSTRLFPHVGTFRYGVYANESIMMVTDLDRRGHHDLAERCLDSWIHYQGTVGLPANFKSKDGIFYGVNGHESGGYNKHHGYVMWGLAEHWRYTRDRAWMERTLPAMIRACDWITSERAATMTLDPDGSRPIEYGFLPSGALEDVQDYWYWLATNAAMVWGFDGLAEAITDYGHPEAARLAREAKAFHDDVAAGLREARIRTPVVRLRDGTYVPKFPSHLHERGRSHGWIRETLEGALFLPVMGLLDPTAAETTWILEDYEDNLYISEQYGYAIPVFNEFWFSRGGISMQANLLDGPLPYLDRDEVKHFLRAYFNGFASAFDPQVRMCNEHSLPELGRPSGDHFKTSDEAQSTSWLRLMFVNDRGPDLLLGQALPRPWLADGRSVHIDRAATHYGPVSLRITSAAASGTIRAEVGLPQRNPPRRICLRLRHPEAKPLQAVSINGRPHTNFDTAKEWIVLPADAAGIQDIVASYSSTGAP